VAQDLERGHENSQRTAAQKIKGNILLNWIVDLVGGLTYIHSQEIVHRDIRLRISLSLRRNRFLLQKFVQIPLEEQQQFRGQAPEYETGQRWGRHADVFSMGCLFVDIMAFGNNINQKALKEFFATHVRHASRKVYFTPFLG
jgi:serine/threonine protein kinase